MRCAAASTSRGAAHDELRRMRRDGVVELSTEADRADWLARTGSAVPADAGAAYKRNGDVDRQPRIVS